MSMESHLKRLKKAMKRTKKDIRFNLSSPSKIAKHLPRAFSMPPGLSCPGETAACEGCYAIKGRHVFRNCQNLVARNYHTFKHFEDSNDVDSAASELTSLITKKAKLFRIHEAGDFYGQFPLSVWDKVCRLRPTVNFWAYTRSFHLDFSSILRNSNFMLWASTDPYNIKKAKAFVKKYYLYGVKHAYGPYEEKTLPNQSFICPATNGKLSIEGACSKCNLCVIKGRTRKHVVFLKH